MASRNLGPSAGLVVAAALLVDYVMTVAVSVAAGVDNIISAVPELNPLRIPINVVFVALLTAMNLRGVRESGKAFAVPTYLFIGGRPGDDRRRVLVRTVFGHPPVAESAGYGRPAPDQVGLAGLALAVLGPARVLVRLHRTDRGRGDLQRGTGVQTAQE